MISTRPDESTDPSADPVAEAAAHVRAQGSESLIAIQDPEAAQELQHEQMDQQERAIRQALNTGDVTLGMSTDEVLRAWGEPRSIDTAGDPSMGNQRWVYYDGLSSHWSMSGKRILYFERGRLAGWEQAR